MKKFKFGKFILNTIILLFTSQSICASILSIDISGIKNNKGFVRLVIYRNAKNFPGIDNYYKLYTLKISGKSSKLEILNLPKGTYAIAVIHDENNSKSFDKNILGMPKEGFGFSNNPRVIFKEPDFKECKFKVQEAQERLSIRMKYF